MTVTIYLELTSVRARDVCLTNTSHKQIQEHAHKHALVFEFLLFTS